jgi:hypothetical protein
MPLRFGLAIVALVAAVLSMSGNALGAAPSRMYYSRHFRIMSLDVAPLGKEVVRVPHIQSKGAPLAVTKQYLFWIDGVDGSPVAALWRSNRDGSDPHPILKNVYSTGELAVIGSSIYILEAAGISRAALDGSGVVRNVVKLAPGVLGNGADGLATDGRYLYFSNCDKGTISRVSPDGSGLVERFIVTGNDTCPQALATAGKFIYWGELDGSIPSDPGRIGRALLDGSQANDRWLLVRSHDAPYAIATDGRFIYWTHVLVLPKHKFRHDIDRARVDGTHLRRTIVSDPATLGPPAFAPGP